MCCVLFTLSYIVKQHIIEIFCNTAGYLALSLTHSEGSEHPRGLYKDFKSRRFTEQRHMIRKKEEEGVNGEDYDPGGF